MATLDTESLQAEVNALRDEIRGLNELVKNYMTIAAHFCKVNAELRGRLKLYEPVEDFADK